MQAVIIAAGESSRFWPLNQDHKSLVYLFGKPLIYWTIKGLMESGIKDTIIVCGPDSSMKEMLAREIDFDIKISYTIQEEPLGTGNALWQAKELIREAFVVLWPDKITSGNLVEKMAAKLNQEKLGMVLVGAKTATPWEYGIIKLEGDIPVGIQEKPEPGKEPSDVKAVGAYLFEPDFFNYYATLPKHHETDLTDVINIYMKEHKASLVLLDQDVPTLKYPWDLFQVNRILMDIFLQPQIAANAVIAKNAIIEGNVWVGGGVRIFENAVVKGPCYIGKNCVIGTNALVRDYTNLEEGVVVGAHSEITRSIFQQGTSTHSGFFGDSIIGKNCRFGAGFITANRRFDGASVKVVVKNKKIDTGLTSLGAVVGENSHFGIHSGTMPGVLIGRECVVYPGVHVFENMPDGSLKKSSA